MTEPRTRRLATVSLPSLPALVLGEVRHRRSQQVEDAFRHRLALWLVDVDHLPHHGALASFRAQDHLGRPDATLRQNIVAYLEAQGERTPLGRIVMLASARVAGYVFDPLSVFWCFTPSDELLCVVAEVHNTYGERTAYLLHLNEAERAETAKNFYVSPFFEVDGQYRMRFSLSEDAVDVTIDLYRGEPEQLVFEASFSGRPSRASRRAVLRAAVTHPLMPQRVTALIRWHGIKLFLRRLPLIPRPPRPHVDAVDGPPRPPWDAIPDAPGRVASLGRATVARRAVNYASRVAGVRVDSATHHAGGVTPSQARAAGSAPGVALTPAATRRLAGHPKLGLAEGFIAGDWWPAEGTDLADLLTAYADRFTHLLPAWMWRLRRLTDESLPHATRNDRRGSRRNISSHYDLSNELFALFLDPTMSYSSALFADDDGSDSGALERAQLRKLDAALDLAGVGDGATVLEIGTGWGSMAIRAAERGAHVTTITLSQEQAEEARDRVARAGWGDRVDVRVQDYRDVEGTYDAIVSIEMIEAVGEEFWPEYVRTLEARLEPHGKAVIQAITMSHERFLATRRSHGWIQEYIFPGGLIPSTQALADVTSATGLTMRSHRRFGPDYARTLRSWRKQFLAHAQHVQELGFSERFVRMWELYLAYCEAGFASGYLDVEHLVFSRTQHTDAEEGTA